MQRRFNLPDQPRSKQYLVKRLTLAHLFLRSESFSHGSVYLQQLVKLKGFNMLEYLMKYR